VLGPRAVKAAGVAPAELQWLELQCFALLGFRLLWDEEEELERVAEALVLRHEAKQAPSQSLSSQSESSSQPIPMANSNRKPGSEDGDADGDEQGEKSAKSRRNTITFRVREERRDSSPPIRLRGEAVPQPTAALKSHPSTTDAVTGLSKAVATATLG
jgi:hypothetical protein